MFKFKLNKLISKQTTWKTNKTSQVNHKSRGMIYNHEEICFEKE